DAQSNKNTALNWDDVLPESLNELWNKFLVELPDIEKISIPRWIQFAPNQIQSIELHAFCDGATSAYAANVYIRMQYSNGLVHTHLLIAKSKVTPTKPLTIPRIELCGAELATRLAVWVKSNLQISVDQIPIYFWCDATVVLHWIHGDISRWKTYVANRISKILSSTSPKQWSHVGTHDNPADCATRGLTPAQLSKFDLWWKGLEWLVKPKKDWPTFKPGIISFTEDLAEVKSSEIHVHVSIQTESIMFLYSSLYKLIRVNAWIRRFRHNALNKLKRMQGELTVAEIQSSLFQLVRLVQAEAFGKEIKCISNNEPLPKKCIISGLAPFLDEQNIVRVRGRLQRSNLPYRQRHPIILPQSHHFTTLVIDDYHINKFYGETIR
ncbi:uncharacterized protein LOC129571558, partial [Sitodiplosis mosellana]|uniref:uncharacterized protein LOC129571558 n=1 Tax=Sitodiplosis mosellana TaxID=263140 RepID=UPI0024451D45